MSSLRCDIGIDLSLWFVLASICRVFNGGFSLFFVECLCYSHSLRQAGTATPFVPRGGPWRNRFVFISDVFVAREWRGRRLAGKMIESAVSLFSKTLFPEIFAAVYAGNEASLALFRNLKFELFHSIVEREVRKEEEERAEKPAELFSRTFCAATDRELILSGLAAASDRPLADEEAEYARFCQRFAESTRMYSETEGGAAAAWATFEITSETPYGVMYGEYFARFGFAYYVHIAPTVSGNNGALAARVLAALDAQCRGAGVATLKSGYGAPGPAELLRGAGFADCIFLLRRDNV